MRKPINPLLPHSWIWVWATIAGMRPAHAKLATILIHNKAPVRGSERWCKP